MNTLVPLPAPCPPGRVPEVCLVVGDAGAAVRIAPLAGAMAAGGRVRPVVLVCGHGAGAATAALAEFRVGTDVTVALAADGQPTTAAAAQLLAGLDRAFADRLPDAVVVQGDSATAFSAAMAAFWRRVPVVHLDAGVRSFDLTAPFPQEGHRRLIAQVSSLHLAATPEATANLAQEAHTGPKVVTVGSTAVDAALDAVERRVAHADPRVRQLADAVAAGYSRLVPVVLEAANWSASAVDAVLHGICDLVLATPDLEVVLPATGGLRARAEEALGRLVRVTITDPLPQPCLLGLLSTAAAVVTDSVTLAEQSPSFGVSALVVGGESGTWTEPSRPGYPWAAGADRAVVARITEKLVLSRRPAIPEQRVADGNPFGDGLAAARCAQAVQWLLGLRERPGEFVPARP
ncbi:UDP-N-acetylglucosamine 2-epimerase [Actinokineospora spheciospongiae]|uniref:UDP-N-acetylglucosamine 2-epimerase n=1 Tax=Actinokineospora spheciospongiae TaxID=909613 RepID=UPI0011B7DEFE|nr:UDP-N-acetylglucosamine 2-epimerase [Actinokineospora spheciospongiae]